MQLANVRQESGGWFGNGNFYRAKAHAHLGPNNGHKYYKVTAKPFSLLIPFAFMILVSYLLDS
jgi:hypothetical protein